MADDRRAATPFPVGVNLYPIDAERLSSADWYDRDLDAEFEAIASAGLSLARVFLSWRFFEPQVGLYGEEAEERLERLVEAARIHQVRLIVTLFADDRVSDLLDVPWGRKRDPRTDPYLVQRQVSLAQRVVNRYRGEPSIYAWDLANEAFLVGFRSLEALSEWTRALREAIREIDQERPIMLSIDPETFYRATALDVRRILEECELCTSHVTSGYVAYSTADGPVDSGPSTYLDSFLLRLAGNDRTILLDDVGVLSPDHSAGEEAAYMRTVLFGGLMNRAEGALIRRWRDLETERREPYYRDPYEALVGVVGSEGEAKPTLAEVRRFLRVASRLDPKRYRLAPERVGVVLPAERYSPLPALSGLLDPRSCLQAYSSAKEAHLPVHVVREEDDLEPYGMLVVPSATGLGPATWGTLRDFVQNGGALVLSYGGGEADPVMRDLFGMEFLGDYGRRESLGVRIAQPGLLGDLVSFDAGIELPHFALLGQGGATVVATDAKGSPLLTSHAFGQGRAIYVSAPLERALAHGDPWAAPPQVRALLRNVYRAAAEAVGASWPVSCDRPEVEIALFNGDEDDVLVLLNHVPAKVTANVTFSRAVDTVGDLRGGAASPVGGKVFGVPLGPNGAAALRLTYG